MSENQRSSFRLSFIAHDARIPVPSADEVLARVRSAAAWDEASISPVKKDFPRLHIAWHEGYGFIVHCFENNRSPGQFLVNSCAFSAPSIEINIGGQALERWPQELFVSEALAAESLEHFLEHGEPKPSLSWTRTGDFPRDTIWQGREEREIWERAHRGA